MFTIAAGFCSGAFIGHQCNGCDWVPQVQYADDETAPFKLSVRVLSASIPTIDAPGLLMRQRPRAQVALGLVTKETEPAEFSGSSSSGRSNSFSGVDCPWRFGDTLTVSASLADVLGPGLQLRLNTNNEAKIGPLKVKLASVNQLGECTVDLRRRVLPACVRVRHCDPDGATPHAGSACTDGSYRVWESPVLVFALTHVSGNQKGVSHVALTFAVTADPEELMNMANSTERSLATWKSFMELPAMLSPRNK